MLKRKIRALAVTGITLVAAALLTLGATAASAATATASAPGHLTAPQAAAAAGCVTQTFGIWDENTYERCVRDEQVLLNDLYYAGVAGATNGLIKVDGYYGNKTFWDVVVWQEFEHITIDGKTGPQTWDHLCVADWDLGFTGTYWHDAGCNTEPGL